VRNPAGRRKLAAESVSDGESLKNKRPEDLLPGHSALFIPCRPRNPERDRPRDIGDRGSPARLHEQMRQKQSKQLPAREISRRVDFPLQHFVECAGIARTEILLWRNKCLTVAAFAANSGILCFPAEENCPLIAHVNDRRKQQTATDPHSVAIADRQRHHICARQFCSRLPPDHGCL
jgi:hypothetical protein